MRWKLIMLGMLCTVTSALAAPNVSVTINLPAYPRLVQVPGYPVYYSPNLSSNYFFYDGFYWVYDGDTWYMSAWYNGPWRRADPLAVPVPVLRVPIRYYRKPPDYFKGWKKDEAPHWGDYWGREWRRYRAGWDKWDPRSVRGVAPLPVYQGEYSAERYPRAEEQRTIHARHYSYQPKDIVIQQHFSEPHEKPEKKDKKDKQDKKEKKEKKDKN